MRPGSSTVRSVTVRPTRPSLKLTSRAARLATPAFVIGAAVILAACGSSDSSTKASASTTSTSAADSTSTAVVETVADPQLGTILVDTDGKTLYTLTNGGQAVACTGACLAAWPPLLLPPGTTEATGSSGVTDLGTTPAGSDEQVTHAGLPLYRFAADTAAGDANGEGIASFGGTWHVVKVSGTSPSSSSSTSTTEKSSSGY
ncbi:MAG: COG4315 family predicted lipoprotein [Acidimicrobiia bacterium]